jgi:hypothetical protein
MIFEDIQTKQFENEVAYKVFNSSVNRYPYAHSQSKNFLPKPIIDLLLDNWPSQDEFISNMDAGITTTKSKDEDHPYNFRYQLAISEKEDLNRIKGKKFEIWNYFSNFLFSPQIIEAFLSLYAPIIFKRHGMDDLKTLYNNFKIFPRINLIHDKTNYALGPHTDNPQKLVVFLIYFDSDLRENKDNSMGTSVYVANQRGFKCEKGIHYPNKYFYKVFSADFTRNNMFSFCRTDTSFHGVEKVGENPIERKLLQWSLYGVPK